MKTAPATTRKPRHTPRARRANCAALRSTLDPWYYPDLESFLSAVSSGTVRTDCAARSSEELAYLHSIP